MTILGNFRRRKDRERAMKGRRPISKAKPHYPQSRQLTNVQSPSPGNLVESKFSSKKLSVLLSTEKTIQIEIMDLEIDKKPVTVAAMANALAGSRPVVSLHANGDSPNPLTSITRRLQNLAFRRNRVENDSMKRRYEIVNAFNRLEKMPGSISRMVSTWEDAKKALSAVLSFPTPDENSAVSPTEKDVDEVSSRFARAMDDCFQQPQADNLVPLTSKWKQVAAFPSPQKLKANDSEKGREGDLTLDEHTSAVAKADRLFALRVSSAAEALEDVLRSKSKMLEERMLLAEQEAEAKKRASALMRPLSDDERERVREAIFGIGPPNEQLATCGPDYVQRASMQTLRPGSWLNDEVIHYFLLMLANRDEALCQEDSSRKRSHFFKSFFITKLLNEGHATMHGTYDYKNVKRWSKKVPGKDLFNLDKIFFPINQNQAHWLCACAFISKKRIEVYDSMGSAGTKYLQSLFQYLKDEHQAKKGTPLPNPEEWELVQCRDDVPQQRNCNDCGVFTCMFIDFLSKDCPLVFGQDHITQCRERIALSILNGKAIM